MEGRVLPRPNCGARPLRGFQHSSFNGGSGITPTECATVASALTGQTRFNGGSGITPTECGCRTALRCWWSELQWRVGYYPDRMDPDAP